MKVLVQGKEYKICFKHSQFEDHPKTIRGKFSTRLVKGITECKLFEADTKVIFSAGFSYCSVEDNFNKVEGRKIALRDALRPVSREDRQEVWKQYFFNINEDRFNSFKARHPGEKT